MASSPAAIMERVKEIHRAFQEQIDAKRVAMAEPSTTSLGAEAKANAQPTAGGKGDQSATLSPQSSSVPSAAAATVSPSPYQKFYAPNSFVGQWLDRYPDTTLKDITGGHSTAPLRSFFGVQAAPLPVAEPAGFAGVVQAAAPTAPTIADASAGGGSDGGGLLFGANIDEADGEEEGGAEMAELVALGGATEVSQWLRAVRDLQAEGRTAANDWSAAEQRQVEAMVREELEKTKAAQETEDDKGYQRLQVLQTIAEQLGAISRRASFDEMPASDSTVDEWLEALRARVEDWYLNKRDAMKGEGGTRTEAKAATRKAKLAQISSGLAGAAAHEGLLLTAAQLDQVLQAFYQQDTRRAMLPTSSANNGNGGGNGLAASPATQRDVTRLGRQLTDALAREDAVRRVMAQRNKALLAEIGRLNKVIEVAAGYGLNTSGVPQQPMNGVGGGGASTAAALRDEMAEGGASRARGVSFSSTSIGINGAGGAAANSTRSDSIAMMGGGGPNLVSMLAEQTGSGGANNSGGGGGEDYGLSSMLRNRAAVESLNSITFVVAEALSRRRMRTLQAQVDKLRAALVSMKGAHATSAERLHGLSAENATLRAELADFGKTFAAWRAIKEQQDAEKRRIAKEGGSELATQKEVMNILVQRTAALLSQVLRTMGETVASGVRGAAAARGVQQQFGEGLVHTPRAAAGRRMSYGPAGALLTPRGPDIGGASPFSRRRSNTNVGRRPSGIPYSHAALSDAGSAASSRRSSLGRGVGNSHEDSSAGPLPIVASPTSHASTHSLTGALAGAIGIGASVSPSSPRGRRSNQHSSGTVIAALAQQQHVAAEAAAAGMAAVARSVEGWVAFANGTIPSDSSRMLLSDLGHEAAGQAAHWGAVRIGGEQSPQTSASPPLLANSNVNHSNNSLIAAPPSTSSSGADGIVEALSHRLDQTICEVKDKHREERYMRSTIRYFVKRVEAMVAGTYAEDPEAAEEDEEERRMAALREGQRTTLTGVRSPLDKLKPAANIKVSRVFPPRAATAPDSEYAYAWPDETAALQRLFTQLKAALTHEVERTETTNAIVGALERYRAEGPAYRGGGTGLSAATLAGATATATTVATGSAQSTPPPAAGPGHSLPPLALGAANNAKRPPIGDPLGLLSAIQQVNAKEEGRGFAFGGLPGAGNPAPLMRGAGKASLSPLPTPQRRK